LGGLRKGEIAALRRSTARFREPECFMFGQRKNTPIDLHNAMARYIKPACLAVNLPPIGWHTLRHIYTTWGCNEGVRPEVLRDLLGHSSVTTTLNIYAHVGREQLEAAKRIEQYALRGRAGKVGVPTWSPLSYQGVN
jgi:site-specific recombinase XerD